MFRGKFFHALSVFSGTIIGVGLFSLPYLAVKSGFRTIVVYFFFLVMVVILIDLMYGEVASRTFRRKRLPGYVKKYLGKKWQRIAALSSALGFYGALLAYLIVGGEFLTALCRPFFGGNNFIYTLAYFILGALLIYVGIKHIAQTEFYCFILFFVILLLIFYRSYPMIEIRNFFNFNWQNLFLPYGPILFSLSGAALIPEVREMLKAEPKNLKGVIISGVVLASLVYLFFIFVVVGLTGRHTSTEAVAGLREFLGNGVVKLSFAFGFLTTFTSFITLGLTLNRTFHFDFRLNKNFAWLLTCFIPFALYLLGMKDFIGIISFTGAVALGAEAIFIILVYLKAKTKGDVKPAYQLNLPNFLVYSLILLFVLGVVYQIWYFVR